jgi:hypothetical protein
MSALLDNFTLWVSLLAVGIAQVVKIPIHYWTSRKWDLTLLFSTGGMPSSHSAAVTAMATSVGLIEGFSSTIFGASAVVAVIVMFDAAGVRRHAGEHAQAINELVDDFHRIVAEIKELRYQPRREKEKKLKELLGHKPVEVMVGGVVGIFVSLVLYPG